MPRGDGDGVTVTRGRMRMEANDGGARVFFGHRGPVRQCCRRKGKTVVIGSVVMGMVALTVSATIVATGMTVKGQRTTVAIAKVVMAVQAAMVVISYKLLFLK